MPEPPSRETFYVTTPIYYVNARPHIGHAYSTIVADVLARRHRLLGHDTWFLTGTDEHGQKIERSAAAAGIPPQQFTDEVSATFRTLWKRMGITNDDFIRTTEPRHQRGAQKLFADLHAAGHIYLSTYTGQYSIGEEMFVDGPPGTIGPDGRPTETVTEENFFFRLSAFQGQLIDLIESDTLKITPESSKNEVLSFVRGGLKDLSVSRSSFTWGIPVPEPAASEASQKHVIYVWLDALANYMTAVGYGSEDEPAKKEMFERFWPADLHLVGKEITRFHCVYWPAFLLASGLSLPRQVTANGWLLFDNAKMSKSKGNVVRTETILEGFGEHVYGKQFPESTKEERDLFASDVLRYFLLREIPFGQDGSFSFEAMWNRYNADLTNGYGNLVSRTLNLVQQSLAGEVPVPDTSFGYSDSIEEARRFAEDSAFGRSNPEGYWSGDRKVEEYDVLRHVMRAASIAVNSEFAFLFNIFLAEVSHCITMTDKYISDHAPWKLAKSAAQEDGIKLVEVLATACESIRIITALLYPFLPHTTAKVWSQLGLGSIEQASANRELATLIWGGLKPGARLSPLSPIFPRADKSLASLMEDLEAAANEKLTPKVPHMPTEDTTQKAAVPQSHPAESLKNQGDPLTDSTHPGAPPSTSVLEIPNAGAQVGASHAMTTERPGTPPHTEAQASGIFSGQQVPDTPQIAIEDFTKVDLRVARIIVAERIPKADKLLRLEVDLGYEQRQILSGIAEWYTPEELLGRKIVIIANLASRKMRGLESRGMLLAASAGEDGKPILATFAEEIEVGTRLR